jgi:predicted dehydrogenase
MSDKIRVLVVGCGHQGTSHAHAYHTIDAFEIAGVVDSRAEARATLANAVGGATEYDDFDKALADAAPDAVSVNTYPDTHARFVNASLEQGAHVFVEKPLAETVADARSVVETAKKTGKKVVVGYILRHHPSWTKFVEIARTLGAPLVMRMNLNQQSSGPEWETHKQLLSAMSPIVDCGVHYVDIMCQMTRSKPIRVQGMGARVSDDIDKDMYNYGQLQVVFEDGSVGWYEAGWGPMMSETAFFVKDVVGPNGCVSIVSPEGAGGSSDVSAHTKTNRLLLHHAELGPDGTFVKGDEPIDMSDEPDHQELCNREQAYFLKAIREDLDLTDHLEDAVNSLRIVLAADESVRTGKTVSL